jgi:hypothetical protein
MGVLCLYHHSAADGTTGYADTVGMGSQDLEALLGDFLLAAIDEARSQSKSNVCFLIDNDDEAGVAARVALRCTKLPSTSGSVAVQIVAVRHDDLNLSRLIVPIHLSPFLDDATLDRMLPCLSACLQASERATRDDALSMAAASTACIIGPL